MCCSNSEVSLTEPTRLVEPRTFVRLRHTFVAPHAAVRGGNIAGNRDNGEPRGPPTSAQSAIGKGTTMPSADENLIAIDVLLQPDLAMTEKSKFINARLRENYRAGYELDAAHMPHVTLLQRFVRIEDLKAVFAAITKVLVAEQPAEMKLTTKSLDYVMFAGLAVTVLVVERDPELVRLHHKITDAVAPFSVSGGTAAAFADANAIAETVDWVETFVPKASGANYLPHLTAGAATETFVKQLKAAPFEPLTFKSDGVAVYQVGNFGTAAKKLWEQPLHKTLPS